MVIDKKDGDFRYLQLPEGFPYFSIFFPPTA